MSTVGRICGTLACVLVVALVLRVSRDMGVAAAYGQLPLTFEANQGQTDGQVQFMARSQGMHVFLTPTEAVLVLPPPTSVPLEAQTSRRGRFPDSTEVPLLTPPPDPTVVRLHFVGAHPTPQMVGLEELPGKSNYFIGNDPTQWRTNIPTYAKVKYREVYPGVDVLYYGNTRHLEYDVIVAPGADPSVITLAIAHNGTTETDQALPLRLDATGDLILETAGGALRLHQPVVYQEIAGVKHTILFCPSHVVGCLPEPIVGVSLRPARGRHMALRLLGDGLLDEPHGLVEVIREGPDAQVCGRDGLQLLQQGATQPVAQRRPEVRADEDHRHAALHLARLDERQHFEAFVEGPVATRKEDVGLSREVEHHLATEKIVKAHGAADVGIDTLLVGQLNVQATESPPTSQAP